MGGVGVGVDWRYVGKHQVLSPLLQCQRCRHQRGKCQINGDGERNKEGTQTRRGLSSSGIPVVLGWVAGYASLILGYAADDGEDVLYAVEGRDVTLVRGKWP